MSWWHLLAETATSSIGDETTGIGPLWTVIGLGAVLILLGILFVTRKVAGWFLSSLVVLAGAGLVLLAVFGWPLGIIQAFLGL